ncbi:MAG TPA: hypothetical protein VF753_04835 [Terriglobales bacterium]
MLATYIADTQNLLNDAGGQFFRETVLTSYINRARRRIAMLSGCVRVMPPGTQTVTNQESYKFSDWTALVQTTPGVREIFAVRSLAMALGPGQGAWKPVWNYVIWTDFQARFRIWNHSWTGAISYPGYWSQYSFGTTGSLYLAPIPSMIMPMELDFSCMPFPLQRDEDPECIPQPWCDAVCYFAAFLCMLQQQRPQDAQLIVQLFQSEMPACASIVAPQRIMSPYGAVVRAV